MTDETSQPTAEILQVLFESASRLAVRAAPLKRIAIQANGISLELEWPSPPNVSPPPGPGLPGEAAPDSGHYCVRAPTVGTFYHRPEPGAEPFVRPGSIVQPGQQVAILEAMKLMMPVQSEVAGRVVEMLAPDASPVEYASPLMLIDLAHTVPTDAVRGVLVEPGRPNVASPAPVRPA